MRASRALFSFLFFENKLH